MGTERKKAFLVYCDYKQHLELLTTEECGLLFIALLEYADTKKPPELDGMAAMAFSFIKAQMDRDEEKYEERCSINRENGAKGGRPRKNPGEAEKPGLKKPKKTEKTERFSGKPKKPDTDNDTDTENDNETDTGTETGTGMSYTGSGERAKKDVQTLRFDAFWEAYPVKKAKQSALKAWNKIKPNAELFNKIMVAVDRQKHSVDWVKDNGAYIPHPTTWLNGGRWDDELTEAAPETRHINKPCINMPGMLGGIIQDDEGGGYGGGMQNHGTGIQPRGRNGTPAGFKSE